MLSAESAVGRYPLQAVKTMTKTIISTERYKKDHIEDFKNKIDAKKDPVKSIVLSVKDLAYNPSVKAIIAFSNSGKTAKIVSAMRPRVKNNNHFSKYKRKSSNVFIVGCTIAQ